MKKIKQIFAAALIVAGSVFSLANVFAQSPPITPVDTVNYKNGVEKYIGEVVPLSGNSVGLTSIGFIAPGGSVFTTSSYSLKSGRYFSISSPEISPANTLYLSVNFSVGSPALPFGDVLDTLTISANGASDFVLPLRATNVPFTVDAPVTRFPDIVLPGTSSSVQLPITITTVNQNLDFFTGRFIGDTLTFVVNKTGTNPGNPISTVGMEAFFNPPTFAPETDSLFRDTLLVTHWSYPELSYKISFEGLSANIVA
ncbi:MAG: hypothetical protein LBG15_08655, partial [Dysgonamonadaceae bacterium]|nr:hypothetical protein [Dysgonamonadaceae bacterium]